MRRAEPRIEKSRPELLNSKTSPESLSTLLRQDHRKVNNTPSVQDIRRLTRKASKEPYEDILLLLVLADIRKLTRLSLIWHISTTQFL